MDAAVRNAYFQSGGADFVISVSSGISEAWKKYPDLPWEEAAAKMAENYHHQIIRAIEEVEAGS